MHIKGSLTKNIFFFLRVIFCLIIFFHNRLEPDEGFHIVGPDLDPNCWTL